MIRMLCAALLMLAGLVSVARAADEPSRPAPTESAPPAGMPAPTESAPPPPGAAGPVVSAGELAEEAPAQRVADLSYGVAARLRWISVPEWMLNLFTKENVPLSSWGTGFEVFRRKANFDLVLSFNYQNMSPPPGNWLGVDHEANLDTDYVVMNNLSLLSGDISFIWHANFNDWFGMHFGGGVGIAWVRGEVLRISNGPQCTDMNAGDITQCYPVGVQQPPPGSETINLPASYTTPKTDVPDTQQNPHQFVDKNKPPVLPVINTVIGLNFRLPQVRGWEARIEGGFYNAFFVGGAVGYTF